MACFAHTLRGPLVVQRECAGLCGLDASFSQITDFTEGWEGGLTDDLADNASRDPVPGTWTQKKNGKPHTSNHWHTNKGVTWATFKSNALRLGYKATPQLFFQMPKALWLKIAKARYWDVIDLDNYKSQAIANLMFSWQWGSGYGWRNRVQQWLQKKGLSWDKTNFKKLTDIINRLTKVNERLTFEELIEQKMQYLQSLSDWGRFGKGWTNRLNDLRTKSLQFIGRHKAATGGGLLLLTLGAFAIMKRKAILTALKSTK